LSTACHACLRPDTRVKTTEWQGSLAPRAWFGGKKPPLTLREATNCHKVFVLIFTNKPVRRFYC